MPLFGSASAFIPAMSMHRLCRFPFAFFTLPLASSSTAKSQMTPPMWLKTEQRNQRSVEQTRKTQRQKILCTECPPTTLEQDHVEVSTTARPYQ